VEILAGRLTSGRLAHSLNVSKEAVRFAEKYGGDVEKAELAGLLHDIMKNTPPEETLDYIQSQGVVLTRLELSAPKLWHAVAGALYLRNELGIDDAEVLDAVRYHTTGRAGMSLLEKIIFIADFTSEDRDYNDVDVIRSHAERSLDEASLYGIIYVIRELLKKNRPVHADSVDLYNELIIGELT